MLISNTSYFKAIAGSYNLSPFDLNGNIIPQITIECDSTLGAITIDLFEINELLGRRNFILKVVDIAGQAATNNITIQTSGSDVIDEAGNTQLVLDTDKSGAVISPISNSIWISLDSISSGGTTTLVIPVTTVALDTLIGSAQLIPGITYHDTDKNIWFQAISNQELSVHATRSMRVVKPEYYVPAGNILGSWYQNLPAVNAGDLCVYGGKVWQNVNGNVGTFIDLVTLDAEWSVLPKSNNTYYESKIFDIIYDYLNSHVEKQLDEKGNVIGCPFIYMVGFPENPCDFTDWNLPLFFNNTAFCISNNYCSTIVENRSTQITYNESKSQIAYNVVDSGEGITSNIALEITRNNASRISSNTAPGGITGNIVTSGINGNEVIAIVNNQSGRISENKGTINILQNHVQGSIQGNQCLADISFNCVGDQIAANTIGGGITGNYCLSITNNLNTAGIAGNIIVGSIIANTANVVDISYNMNQGDIASNDNLGGISKNNNAGNIVANSNQGVISSNSNAGNIVGNTNQGEISQNSNLGNIGFNSNTSDIASNNNLASIENNENDGQISGNSNTGSISANSNTDRIVNNKNNGGILGITNVTNAIYNNVNNGEISTSVPGDITDPVVNK